MRYAKANNEKKKKNIRLWLDETEIKISLSKFQKSLWVGNVAVYVVWRVQMGRANGLEAPIDISDTGRVYEV
jgi:hypothetical protein